MALIAIGNGTASRESERLVADVIKHLPAGTPRPTPVIVSEAGASVYSASELASLEFPDVDVSIRGAVSIARRLQDPLAELVKIEPQAIGVGQYQHDVDQRRLAQSLAAVVEDAVNAVGVDLNMASAPLLSHIAGLGPSLAQAVVAHRDENGPFATRKALLKVAGLGPKAFQQCAGFLRITNGTEPLDASSVHPEAYGVARKIVQACGRDIRSIMGDSTALKALRAEQFVDDSFGLPTVRDILAELEKPGRDPRPSFRTATFADGIDSINDLKPGMSLEGTVTNVAAFGAFVDIGVHQDGLVHVSQLADRFVKDPHEVVKAGDVVRVRVDRGGRAAQKDRSDHAQGRRYRPAAAWGRGGQAKTGPDGKARTGAAPGNQVPGRLWVGLGGCPEAAHRPVLSNPNRFRCGPVQSAEMRCPTGMAKPAPTCRLRANSCRGRCRRADIPRRPAGSNPVQRCATGHSDSPVRHGPGCRDREPRRSGYGRSGAAASPAAVSRRLR